MSKHLSLVRQATRPGRAPSFLSTTMRTVCGSGLSRYSAGASNVPEGHWLMSFKRFKHNKSARMGNRLQKLDEMAHEKARENSKKNKNKTPETASTVEENMEDDEDGQDDEDEFEEHDEMVLPDPTVTKDRMGKVIESFKKYLKSIRGSEPTPEMFDTVRVEAYGSMTSIQSVAQVVIASHTLANATCFDPSLAKDVAKAIQSQMGLNPSVEEGGVVKIPLPRVSLESRQKMVLNLNKRTETHRLRLRNLRRKVLDVVKKGVAGKLEGISKDDAFRVQKEIEKIADEATATINALSTEKQESILQV